MTALPSAEVVRLPVKPRPRMVAEVQGELLAAGGFRSGNRPSISTLEPLTGPKRPGGIALDRLLENGILDVHHYATARAYAALRRRYDR